MPTNAAKSDFRADRTKLKDHNTLAMNTASKLDFVQS
jgi:hypothetical protein